MIHTDEDDEFERIKRENAMREVQRLGQEIENQSQTQPFTQDWHVIPVNDLREHEPYSTCWCRPTLDEGVWLHHSMDEREKYETGDRKPS